VTSERRFDEADYVGLGVDAALALAEEQGWTPRRLAPGAVVTAEYREGRLNLVAGDDDVVARAYIG
jgi:hypothetical protein